MPEARLFAPEEWPAGWRVPSAGWRVLSVAPAGRSILARDLTEWRVSGFVPEGRSQRDEKRR